MFSVWIVIVNHEFFGNTLSANNEQTCPSDEGTASSKNEATIAVRGDTVGATRREEEENVGLPPRRTLLEYCRECEEMINVGRFSAMAVDGKNLVMYDRNNLQRDTALGA